MRNKKTARLRIGNETVFTRVGTRLAPTPDQFPVGEIADKFPTSKGVVERELREREELDFLEGLEEDLQAGDGTPATPKRPVMWRDPAAAAARHMVLRAARQRPKGQTHPSKARMAAITSSLLALPLPVACFLIVPTGTPWYGTLWCSHQVVSVAIKPP